LVLSCGLACQKKIGNKKQDIEYFLHRFSTYLIET
jgi:hypothetical protein